MKSNILVTGGLGYIGSHTVVRLVEHGFNVVIVDNLINSNINTLDFLNLLTNKALSFYRLDISDTDGLKKIIAEESIDSVIHFAGLKSVEDSINYPNQYYQSNVIGMLSLLSAIKENNITNFIFSSSATVYSDDNNFPVTEKGILGYKNPYAQTKLISEDILNRFHSQTSINVSILRYFNPIGNIDSGELGDKLTQNSANIMPMIFKSILDNIPFKIYGSDYCTEDGTAIRDYIHVDDLAMAHYETLKFMKKNNGIYTFNIGTGEGVSVLHLLKTFSSVNKVHLPFSFHDRRKGDIGISFANVDKIKNIVGWSHKKNLEDMCVDAYFFLKKNYML
jgi:UDP-glucose 4-epimerase